MNNEDVIKSPDTARKHRVPPGQRITGSWPVLHYGEVPSTGISRWTFTISGLVNRQRTLNFQEFMALPRMKVFSDIHCVTGWSKLNNLWEGVSTSVIKQLVDILPEARFVMVNGAGGFTTNLSLDDFFQPDVLLAINHNGEPLTPEHGYPVRLVVPRLYFWKSAKWVGGVEFIKENKRGFWETYGYHNHGDPWKEERYSD
jgi:DMSO/TMAO reductase YedYZ molybdopterin-dependent catalytic subunit